MKAIFINGQSCKHSCKLSPIQEQVAGIIRAEGVSVAPLNFPYDARLQHYHRANLVKASFSNSLQYLLSRTQDFKLKYRNKVLQQFQKDSIYLVIAGSCGLELFNNLQLPNSIQKKTHVFAYGPVARKLPDSNITLVQGRHDSLSKCFFKEVDFQVNCGHMDYLELSEVITLLLREIHSILGGDKKS